MFKLNFWLIVLNLSEKAVNFQKQVNIQNMLILPSVVRYVFCIVQYDISKVFDSNCEINIASRQSILCGIKF